MTTIMPEGQNVKKAIKYVEDQLQEQGGSRDDRRTLSRLCEEASVSHNLSPRECEFLERFYMEGEQDR